MSTLYLVATPIGNLDDISARALQVLDGVHLIAAEDTRQTTKLLQRFDIHTQMISYHEHSKAGTLSRILEKLEEGDIALVSDAGTPALNDPGYMLVRAALEAGHEVSPIPGACAPVAALVASGLPTDAFLYLGYLPRKKAERRRLLDEVSRLPYTLVLLETPHRLLSALEDIQAVLGDREVAVARELTKLHEEIFRGKLSAARASFTDRPPRGEFTLVLAGCPSQEARWSAERVRAALDEARSRGGAASRVAREVAAISGWSKSEVYALLTEMQSHKQRTSHNAT